MAKSRAQVRRDKRDKARKKAEKVTSPATLPATVNTAAVIERYVAGQLTSKSDKRESSFRPVWNWGVRNRGPLTPRAAGALSFGVSITTTGWVVPTAAAVLAAGLWWTATRPELKLGGRVWLSPRERNLYGTIAASTAVGTLTAPAVTAALIAT
ncbi:MAG: hypothetical protein ACRCYU_05225, partial [Nocardioides sp.]